MQLVHLSNGRAEVLPDNALILNPEYEGETPFVFLGWVSYASNLIGFEEALEGAGPCNPFAFFSDFADLHLFTHEGVVLDGGASQAFADLWYRIFFRLENEHLLDTKLVFFFFRVDSLGGPTPIGASPIFEVTR